MKPVWVVLGTVLCGSAIALAEMPWTLKGEARRAEIAAAMGRDVGLAVEVGGPVTVKLLPRPRVQISDVSVKAPDGSLDLSAPTLTGELDVSALLQGRWRLVSATLSNPTAAIDVDATSHAITAGGPRDADDAPFKLSVRSGVVRLVSRRLATETILTDIGATLDASAGAGGALSASGSAVWRDLPGQFVIRIGQQVRVADEPQASAFVQISTSAGSFSAAGVVSSGDQPRFAGRLSAATGAPNRLLAAFGGGPLWTNVQKISLSGDALARFGDLALSEAALRVNSTTFEGTLGYHTDKGHGLVEGTLAAGQLDLGDLVGRPIDGPALAAIYRAGLAPYLLDTNLDLRISASRVDIGRTGAEDVAFSLLCRDRRLELTLDEALAFGGVVKARLLASLGSDDLEAHADMALSDIELGPFGVALTGDERMTGTMNGKISVDGHGTRLSDIVPTLAGEGRVAVDNGSFVGMSVSQALKRITRRLPFGADEPGRLTAFAAASSDMRIVDGTVNFVEGKVTGPGMAMAFAGRGDLPGARVDLVGVASQTDAAGAPVADVPGLPIEMRAAWGEPLMLMERSRRTTLPRFGLPSLDPGETLP